MTVDPSALAELRRRVPDPERIVLVVAAATEGEVVINVDPSMQSIFVAARRHPNGVPARRPAADVVELLGRVGAVDTAAEVASPAPPGHTWVAWLGFGCSLAVPWPAPGLDEIAGATLTVGRPDLALLADQARAGGHAFRDLCFVVGSPERVERITGRKRCGCLVAAAGVDRAGVAAEIRAIGDRDPQRADVTAGIARDILADVPAGHVRVLIPTASVGSVATIPVPRRGERLPRYVCDGGWS